jgi:NAD(P)-dependent dehydrogenase (short-subunit alcohol dehydrogenase family)
MFDGKVAFITGGARGQGRAHAIALAREGADIPSVDICRQLASVEYTMSSAADHEETVRLVEGLDRRIVALQADVRDYDQVAAAVATGLDALGHIDFVAANAGIMPTTGPPSHALQAWQDAIDTMLSGVFHTLRAAVPSMVERSAGGSIVLTGSTSSKRAVAHSTAMLSPGQMGMRPPNTASWG